MTIEAKVRAHLLTKSAITAIIGSGNAARLYPVVATANAAAPYIVYFKVSSVRLYQSDGRAGTERARIQISSYAATYAAAKDLAGKIITAMDDFMGGSIEQTNAFIQNENDLFDLETKLYHVPVDYFVWGL